jgi:hypothetical protein
MQVVLIDPALSDGDGRVVPSLADHGLETLVVKGVPVQVPDELGARMLEQVDVWARPDAEGQEG